MPLLRSFFLFLVLDSTEMSRLTALANCGHGNVSNTVSEV
jgi:hypothetical protein